MSAQHDLDRSLAAWFADDASSPPPSKRLERILTATRGVRPRPAFMAGVGGAWVGAGSRSGNAGRDALRPILAVVLLGLLAVALGGGALVVGGQLASNASVENAAGAPGGLIMISPDGNYGEIRVLRPDGQVQGAITAMVFACRSQTLVADGQRVAFFGHAGPLTIAPLDGSEPVSFPLIRETRSSDSAFSPDGSRLAYLSRRVSDRSDLTILSLVDGIESVVARDLLHASLVWSAWSTRGTLAIGYISDTESGIDLIQADGTDHRALIRQPLTRPSVEYWMDASWSPDGTRLAYALSYGLEQRDETRIVEASTGESTAVAAADGTPFDAWRTIQNRLYFLWSPDGRTVAYLTDTGLGLLDLATGQTRTLPDAHHVVPAWSPDGSRIAFVTSDGSAFRPVDGGRISPAPSGATDGARLTTIRADLSGRVDQDVAFGAREIAWSPDGRRIAVLSGTALDLHDPDGVEQPTRIANDVQSRPWSCLTWSPVQAP